MQLSIRSRRRALAGGGALLLAGTAALFFAAPEDRPLPDPPPLVLPPLARPAPGVDAPGHAAAAPTRRTRAQECAGGAAGPIVEPPRPRSDPATWFTSEDYPRFALMRGLGGTAQIDLGVSETGAVIACGVDTSTGHATLDSRTCEVFRGRAQFEPARDDRGCPVAAIWHKRVHWQIEDNLTEPPPR